MNKERFSHVISRVECERIVHQVLDTSDFRNVHYDVHHMSNVAGYLGDYFKIVISYTHENCEEKIYLFAKTLPHTIELFSDIAMHSFIKEEFIYKEYFGMLKSNGFGDILNFTAKFYLSRPNEIVVFEDLSKQDYNTVDIYVPSGYQLLKKMVETLAKFHSCSLLLEEAETAKTGTPFRIGKVFPDLVKDYAFSDQTDTSRISQLSMDILAEYILPKFPEITKKFSMEEFKQKVRDLKIKMFRTSMNESLEYRNVLSHGDCWSANFLVKRDQSANAISCLLIDFQLVRYNPPVIDLFLVIYSSTHKSMRNKYLNQLLKDYHEVLSTNLDKYGFDINKILDFATLHRCFEDLKLTGIAYAICYLEIVLLPKAMKEKLHSDPQLSSRFYNESRIDFLEKEKIWNDTNFTSRVRGLVEDLYEAFENCE